MRQMQQRSSYSFTLLGVQNIKVAPDFCFLPCRLFHLLAQLVLSVLSLPMENKIFIFLNRSQIVMCILIQGSKNFIIGKSVSLKMASGNNHRAPRVPRRSPSPIRDIHFTRADFNRNDYIMYKSEVRTVPLVCRSKSEI